MGEPMNESQDDDTLDPRLLRLFDQAHAPLPDREFVASIEARMRRSRRWRLAGVIAFWVALTAFAGVMTPYVAAGSIAVVATLSEWVPQMGSALGSPLVWVASLALGFVCLRWARVLRR